MKKQPSFLPLPLSSLSLLLAAGLAGVSLPATADDLLQIYQQARQNDPVFAAAQANRDAGQEKKAQGLSGLLPSVNLSANTTWNQNDVTYRSGIYPTGHPQYNSHGYNLTLTQPLFRWQNWLQYDQGKLQTALADVQFVQAEQDLILRVAQAYFDVLVAEENLKAVQAQKQAISQQLEQAKKSFEIGTVTITDTHEAQSRFDLSTAQEIAASSDLDIKRRVLEAILGKETPRLANLKAKLNLPTPQPAKMSDWVDSAEKEALNVRAQEANTELAQREMQKTRAGHYPTVDLVASKGNSTTLASTMIGVIETDFRAIGIQINIPLAQGGYVMSRERETAAAYMAAKSSLEAARRTAALNARQAYLGVSTGLAQVKALEAALVSSQSALEANKLGYQVGVRINIDVLNAEQQVYATKRDLAKARFDTLMAQLRLKAAVGTLVEADLIEVNKLFADS